MEGAQALEGIRVVERSGRLAGRVCAQLLHDLGAKVTRVSITGDPSPDEPSRWLAYPPFDDDVDCIVLQDDDKNRLKTLAESDVLITSQPGIHDNDAELADLDLGMDPNNTVICVLSPFGYDSKDGPFSNPNETEIQALTGLMATTGIYGSDPGVVGIPIIELFAAVNATTSIIAALQVMEAGGKGQIIDAAIFDSAFSLLGTFLGNIHMGRARGLRGGCRHPICAPWNAYQSSDGWVVICSSNNEQWHSLLELMERLDMANDPRFKTPQTRVAHVDAVDAAVGAWAETKTSAELFELVGKVRIPIGPVATIAEVQGRGKPIPCQRLDHPQQPIVPRTDNAHSVGELPLSGIRVLEIGPYTAGPLAGRFLSDLGAEVIKIEPRGGEDSRSWTPQIDGTSIYFANYNAGKRSVVLDLRSESGRTDFFRLAEKSDVLLQNLRAGAMKRLGLGPENLFNETNLRVYCSISGYGSNGGEKRAYDTVIQAEAGLMSLIGYEESPVKAGFSVADLLVGHLAPMEIIAALRRSERAECGQILDLSMLDAVAWLTEISWPEGNSVMPPSTLISVADGWVVARCTEDALTHVEGCGKESQLMTEKLIGQLAAAGINAVKVHELDETIKLPIVKQRRLLRYIEGHDGGHPNLIAAPFGLTASRPEYNGRVAQAGEHNSMFLAPAD